MLSDTQIEFYREQGYLLLENAIPPQTLTALRARIDEFRRFSTTSRLSDLLARQIFQKGVACCRSAPGAIFPKYLTTSLTITNQQLHIL